MRLLADENIPRILVEQLRGKGHNVASVAEDMRGASDEEIIAAAIAGRRIVVTADKDFITLVRDRRGATVKGIVLIRLREARPDTFARIVVVTALESRQDWTGHIGVVSAGGIRMRRLTKPGGRARRRGSVPNR